jgi:hypothetical protein
VIAKVLPHVESARKALNSYVHPNYGSHIAALFPERTAAAELLLESMVVLYEAFFALPWTEHPLAGDTVPTGISGLESWSRTLRRFMSHTLPEIRRADTDPALSEVMKVPELLEWLTTKRPDLEDTLRGLSATELVKDLPRQTVHAAASDEIAGYRIWQGARAMDVLNLIIARRAEELLRDEFPSGAPDPSSQVRWLRFNALSLQLAMELDQVKAGAFKTQLLRQITQGNSLGVLLCVRSLTEHRALAVWLPRQVGASLHATAGQLRAVSPLPSDAARIETSLAKFLSVHAAGTKEHRRAWVMHENGGVRTAGLNLSQIFEAAFAEDDRFRDLYAFASAAMHARSARGIDLTLNAAKVRKQARLIGLLTLERICNQDEEMDHLSQALCQFVQLDHAAGFGGTSAAATDTMAQQVFGRIDGTLVYGIDYTGEGTRGSPFVLGCHIQFHKGSYALLEQLGVDSGSCPRMLEDDVAGHLCDRWRASDRDYWFQVRFLGQE